MKKKAKKVKSKVKSKVRAKIKAKIKKIVKAKTNKKKKVVAKTNKNDISAIAPVVVGTAILSKTVVEDGIATKTTKVINIVEDVDMDDEGSTDSEEPFEIPDELKNIEGFVECETCGEPLSESEVKKGLETGDYICNLCKEEAGEEDDECDSGEPKDPNEL